MRPTDSEDADGGDGSAGARERARANLTGRAAMLALVVCMLAISLAYTLREYLEQRSEIHDYRAKVAAQEITYTGLLSPITGSEQFLDQKVANDPLIFPPADVMKRGERTQRNETYERRIQMLTKLKAAAALLRVIGLAG